VSYRTALFDLDGTLIDSVELILASHRHATRTVLGEALPDDVLRAGIGRPLIAQMRDFDEERATELYDAYRAHNREAHDELLRSYDGVLDVVEAARERGVAIGVVTSKSRDTVALAYARIPLEPLLDVLVAADDTRRHKPEPEPLLLALEQLGADAASACYVGDSPYDVQAAHAARIDAVAVTWGAFGEEALRAERPEAIARTPSELHAILVGDG
jgi:pyrophosphatase PpaX